MQDMKLQRGYEECGRQLIKMKANSQNSNLLQTWKGLLNFRGKQLTDLTDSYSFGTQGKKHNSKDIAQMSFN